jgi:hypothetical protein
MKPLIIERTNISPSIKFNPYGLLSIKGRSLMHDPAEFYQPMIYWASVLNIKSIRLIVELDYFNTSSSKLLLELFRTFDNNPNVEEFELVWNYESDDDGILEKGQIFKERLRKARCVFNELEVI